MLRFFANLTLFLSILFLPWWVVVILGVISVFVFKSFYEIIILGLFGDFLYGTEISSLYNFNLLLSSGALIVFVIAYHVKKFVRFYD